MTVIKNEKARRALAVVIPAALMPAAVMLGSTVFRSRSISWTVFAVSCLTLLLFMAGFENRKTGSRRLVMTAFFIALATAGRVIFTFLPGVNPVTAITVTAAIYLGAEAGFTVGAFSALISNIFAGQGPWTPFQMFSWGVIGLIAGLLGRFLKGRRIAQCVYSFFAGILFSMLMDVYTITWMYNKLVFSAYITAITAALPFTVIYAVSNVVFILLTEKIFAEKLSRIQTKYGI